MYVDRDDHPDVVIDSEIVAHMSMIEDIMCSLYRVFATRDVAVVRATLDAIDTIAEDARDIAFDD